MVQSISNREGSGNILISLDVETTGPCPAVADLVSLGAVALREDTLGECGRIKLRVREPDGGWQWDEDTRRWWAEQDPEVYRDNFMAGPRLSRGETAERLEQWLKDLGGTPVFAAHPACFDWQWINDLFWCGLGRNPFGYRALCIRSLGYGVQGAVDWGKDRADDPEFYVAPERPHDPLSDAVAQAEQLRRIITHVRSKAA